jgi:uncharacterized protein DUF4399
MHLRTHVALLVAVMVGGLGVMAGAQAKKARAFFVEPKNNATVTTQVHMKFGSEGVQIAAVPPGDVTTVRPGVGHYHVGIDVDCVGTSKTIVKGTPSWVHFGKGETEFDSQLSPGKHKLSLQVADDLHNAMPGLCSTITVTAK